MLAKDLPMITIRLPESLHLAIRELAYENRTSMNSLIVDRLRAAVLRNPKAAEVLEREEGKEV